MLYQLSDFIFYLWLLPVTCNIILPLCLLVVWSLNRAVKTLLGDRGIKEEEVALT